ncbi:11536_t:CDS:2, partial [Rhizophagus irregularis]
NEIKILICSAKIDEIPINYTKKFGEIAPQLEKDLIPRIQSLLEQRGIHATLSIVWDVFSDLHKNGQRKWKESQLNEAEIKQKKIMSHIINRLSENHKNLFVYKLSWRSDELTNLLHSIDEYVEKYFPENKRVRPRILKDEFWKNKKAPPNLIWWTLKDEKRESPSVHKSIDEESDDESESESEEEEQSQQSKQSYGLNVDKLDINAESDEEEEGEDEINELEQEETPLSQTSGRRSNK